MSDKNEHIDWTINLATSRRRILDGLTVQMRPYTRHEQLDALCFVLRKEPEAAGYQHPDRLDIEAAISAREIELRDIIRGQGIWVPDDSLLKLAAYLRAHVCCWQAYEAWQKEHA